MSELKPCPFCEKDALQNSELFMSGRKPLPYARCSDRHCCGGKIWHDIEAWNTRPREQALIDELEKARDTLGWISVEDRLPNAPRGVFVYIDWLGHPEEGNATTKILHYWMGDWYFKDPTFLDKKYHDGERLVLASWRAVTHWQEQPLPPKQSTESTNL